MTRQQSKCREENDRRTFLFERSLSLLLLGSKDLWWRRWSRSRAFGTEPFAYEKTESKSASAICRKVGEGLTIGQSDDCRSQTRSMERLLTLARRKIEISDRFKRRIVEAPKEARERDCSPSRTPAHPLQQHRPRSHKCDNYLLPQSRLNKETSPMPPTDLAQSY